MASESTKKIKYDSDDIFKGVIDSKGNIIEIIGLDREQRRIGIDEQREEDLNAEIDELNALQVEMISKLDDLLKDRDYFKNLCIENGLWSEPKTAEAIAIEAAEEQARIAREEAAEARKEAVESRKTMEKVLKAMEDMLSTQDELSSEIKELKKSGKTVGSSGDGKADKANSRVPDGKNVGTVEK